MKTALFRPVCLCASLLSCCGLKLVDKVSVIRKASVPTQLWLAFTLLLVGCGVEKDSLFEEDHEVPPHWPSNLTDAAEKIEQRLALLAGKSSEPPVERQKHDAQQRDAELSESELRDLVAWIPEIVADTDLTEEQWLPVYELCEVMRDHLSSSDVSAMDIKDDFRKLQVLLNESTKLLPIVAEATISPTAAESVLDNDDAAEAEAGPSELNSGGQS